MTLKIKNVQSKFILKKQMRAGIVAYNLEANIKRS